MKLTVYDFVIKHRSSKNNPADASSKRFNYQVGINSETQKLLFTLQNKLRMIDFFKIVNISRLRAICVSVTHICNQIVDAENEILKSKAATFRSNSSFNEERKAEPKLTQCVPRRVIAALTNDEISYDDSAESVLKLIKALQTKDEFVIEKRKASTELAKRCRNRPVTQFWTFDDKRVLRHQKRVYVLDEASVRMKLLQRHHDDILADHFDYEKTLDLLSRKYY